MNKRTERRLKRIQKRFEYLNESRQSIKPAMASRKIAKCGNTINFKKKRDLSARA